MDEKDDGEPGVPAPGEALSCAADVDDLTPRATFADMSGHRRRVRRENPVAAGSGGAEDTPGA
jgi:hypothetical protein